MVGYTTYLRSISKGEAQFVMNFSHYEQLSGQKQADVLNNPLMFWIKLMETNLIFTGVTEILPLIT